MASLQRVPRPAPAELFFRSALESCHPADADALTRLDLDLQPRDRPVAPVGYRLFEQGRDDTQGRFTLHRERTSAGLAAARAEGRIGGRRKKLDPAKRHEIAESVISGRKTGADMARLYNISAPTVSRIVAAHRTGLA